MEPALGHHDDLSSGVSGLHCGNRLICLIKGELSVHVGIDQSVLDDLGDLGHGLIRACQGQAAQLGGGVWVRCGDDPGSVGHQVRNSTQRIATDEINNQVGAVGTHLPHPIGHPWTGFDEGGTS